MPNGEEKTCEAAPGRTKHGEADTRKKHREVATREGEAMEQVHAHMWPQMEQARLLWSPFGCPHPFLVPAVPASYQAPGQTSPTPGHLVQILPQALGSSFGFPLPLGQCPGG